MNAHLWLVLFVLADPLHLQQVLGHTHTRQPRQHPQVTGQAELCGVQTEAALSTNSSCSWRDATGWVGHWERPARTHRSVWCCSLWFSFSQSRSESLALEDDCTFMLKMLIRCQGWILSGDWKNLFLRIKSFFIHRLSDKVTVCTSRPRGLSNRLQNWEKLHLHKLGEVSHSLRT